MRTESFPPRMVQLNTIGPISIDVGKTRLTAGSQQACAVLLYLIAERGKEIARRTLVELLFPESSEAAAGHALRQLIYRLRKMGVSVGGDAASVSLPLDAAVWDVEQAEAKSVFTGDQLDSLSRGYLSDYAPGISVRFTEWLDQHRSTVSMRLRRVLLDQLREEKSRHQFSVVDCVARACLALDPLNEEATLASAEVLVMSGSKAAALSVLDRYIDEVGSRSRDLRFAPKLLRERISDYVADTGLHAEPPLVGRDAEIATLRALLGRVKRGTAEACVVWGNSGIGKTRLLNEACAIAALDGLAVIRCGLQPHDQRRPLAVLRDIAPRLLDMPGALGCSPESLAMMRGLCGRGEMPIRELPRTTQDSEIALARILAAATDLLDAVCSERPVLICVEDAHWLDPASLELIVDAVAGPRALCVLIAAQRPVQLPNSMPDARFNSIEVKSLSKGDSTTLLHRMFERSGRAPDEGFVSWSVGLADGVPFYLQSLFIEYVTTGDRAPIPPSLTASLATKLERLAEPARSVFDSIVVLGLHCTLARLEALVQLPRHSLLTALRELEERALVRSTTTQLSCAHDLLAVTARNRMPLSVKRMLHRSIAEILEQESDGQPAPPWDVAAHWEASGDTARGLSVMRRCAEEAVRVGRPQEAIEILSRARGQTTSEEDRRAIAYQLMAALEAAGEGEPAAAVAAELLSNLPMNERSEVRQSLEVRRLTALHFSGRSISGFEGQLREVLEEGSNSEIRMNAAMLLLSVAEDSLNKGLASEIYSTLERLGGNGIPRFLPVMVYHAVFGDLVLAAEAAETVYLASRNADPRQRVRAAHNSGRCIWWLGNLDGAISRLGEAYEETLTLGLRSGQIHSASLLTYIYWGIGDDRHRAEWHERTERALNQRTTANLSADFFENAILGALDDGRIPDAETLLTRARALAPFLQEGRRSHLANAYMLRVTLAKGELPRAPEVEALLQSHYSGRAFGDHDVVADTLFEVLHRMGRGNEAIGLSAEYVTVWRREKYSIPIRLRHLVSALDLSSSKG